jgi:hypothetical protein
MYTQDMPNNEWSPMKRTRRDHTQDRRGMVLGVLPWSWILGHNLVQLGYMAATGPAGGVS